MDGHVRVGSSDQGQESLDAAGADPVTAAVAGATGMRTGEVAPGVAWLSSRPEYWPPLRAEEVPGAQRGVACLLFGIGAGGAGWLAHLARSEWFAGLEPRAEDLAIAGGAPRGSWAAPAGGAAGGRGEHVVTEAEAFFASAPLPAAWYAAVAVPRGAGPTEMSAALGLVTALQTRRDPLGRRVSVVVTSEAAHVTADAFVRQLLDRGAFVVRAGMGAVGNHLHHFPLRAPMIPRRGRLICVDLADYLHTWRPGRVADLHAIPSGLDAAQALRQVPIPAEGIRALNLGFHLGLGARGNSLSEIDRLATLYHERFLGPDGDMVFTDTERLDGRSDSTDLLAVHEARRLCR